MTIELQPHDMAHGGEAVARLEGKACFVAGAMPGETVTAEPIEDRGSWARFRLESVVTASPDRVSPPCVHFGTCGGCQWQHAAIGAQAEWKRSIVTGQLRHLGRIEDPPVAEVVSPGPPFGYRNRMDFTVTGDCPGLHRYRSEDVEPIESCLLLVPALADLFGRLGDVSGATRLTLRAGTVTGDLLVVVAGEVPPGVERWESAVARIGPKGVEPVVGDPWITEIVSGFQFRIGAASFFQNNTQGAEMLVSLVRQALEPRSTDTLLDAYAGVGLFSVAAGSDAGRVVAIERDRAAISNLQHNFEAAGIEGEIWPGAVHQVLQTAEEYWDLAVCDPPRRGLGSKGVDAVTAATPRRIAYVSCDPASLGRDTRLLDECGYDLVGATPVDLFPQTFHIETVARFDRR